MVEPNTVTQELGKILAKGAGKLGSTEGFGDFFLFVFGAKINAKKVLRLFGRFPLGKIDKIDGCTTALDEIQDFLSKGSF